MALHYEGELNQKELAEETLLAPRTVRYATKRLADAGVVTSRINIRDARQQIYTLAAELQKDSADKSPNHESR